MNFDLKPISEFNFDEKFVQAWMNNYETKPIMSGEIREVDEDGKSKCMCALGYLLDTLVEQGYAKWNEDGRKYDRLWINTGESHHNDNTVGAYSVFYNYLPYLKNLGETKAEFFVHGVFRANDRELNQFGGEAQRECRENAAREAVKSFVYKFMGIKE